MRRRKPGTKPRSVPVAFRLPTKIYEKLCWMAAEQEVDKAGLIRRAVSDMVKGQKRPAESQVIEILADPERQARWEQFAARVGRTIGQVAADALDRLAICHGPRSATNKTPLQPAQTETAGASPGNN